MRIAINCRKLYSYNVIQIFYSVISNNSSKAVLPTDSILKIFKECTAAG